MHPIRQTKQNHSRHNIRHRVRSRAQDVEHVASASVQYSDQNDRSADQKVQSTDQDRESEREPLRKEELGAGASVDCAVAARIAGESVEFGARESADVGEGQGWVGVC